MKWKTRHSRTLINDRWITLRADSCTMPDGRVVEPYYVLDYPDWVAIVAVTVERELLLTRQYRHGLGEILLELPCGGVDSDDASPLQAAKRELLEETGYGAGQFVRTGIVSPNPSSHSNVTHCFLATDVQYLQAPKLDSNEDIESVLMPLDRAIEMLHEGKFMQALHVSALFYALQKL